jgi:hypothetical protein
MIDGYLGSGKTLGMSLKALQWSKRSGATLFSNYGLKDSIPFTSFNDFKLVAQQPSSIICLDESHLDISNRDFNTNSVKFFVNMVFFLRKLRCTLMMTSPLFENIDSKVRLITNVYINVSKSNNIMQYNYYDVERGTYIKTEILNLNKISPYLNDVYDTYEMVVPLEYPKTRDEYLQIFNDVKKINKEYMTSRLAFN